jgi:uncharacterized protein YndB with AHSA1/START domain
MARQSVSKHLAVLEAANLVTTLWRGREKFHYLNAAPINEISERWIDQYDQHRVHALSDLKRALEDTPMQKPTFVYTTYIKTTPEQLWQALTEPAFTQRYWRTTFDTDWKPGSTMTFEIEPAGQMVKLTVVHDDFEPGSVVAELVSGGWPLVLSALKTLLETGESLREVPGRSQGRGAPL